MLCPLKLSGFVVHQINASHKHIQVNIREYSIALYIKFPSYCTFMKKNAWHCVMFEMEIYCFNFISMVCTMIYMGYTLFGNPQGCWYPGVQRFSVVRVLGGDEAEKTSGRDLSNFISMTQFINVSHFRSEGCSPVRIQTTDQWFKRIQQKHIRLTNLVVFANVTLLYSEEENVIFSLGRFRMNWRIGCLF
jgi:hypothetical protein